MERLGLEKDSKDCKRETAKIWVEEACGYAKEGKTKEAEEVFMKASEADRTYTRSQETRFKENLIPSHQTEHRFKKLADELEAEA